MVWCTCTHYPHTHTQNNNDDANKGIWTNTRHEAKHKCFAEEVNSHTLRMSTHKWSESEFNIENATLPGYECQPQEIGVDHSIEKLENAQRDLDLPASIVSMRPCQDEKETLGYRCTCTFQLVRSSEDQHFSYAMRHKGEPILLKADFFPVATKRIQVAMRALLECLNSGDYPALCNNATSVLFGSSWNDGPSSDVFVTLHYDKPLEEVEMQWSLNALGVCLRCQFTQLTGRSKKFFTTVKGENRAKMAGNIRDLVWLARRRQDGEIINVSLENDYQNEFIEFDCLPVHYSKPEGAFFHPNSNVMCQALQWMLSRISDIVHILDKPARLLELYCGCGAHTVALSKAALLDVVAAVEIDPRLVEACEANCRSNGCYNSYTEWKQIQDSKRDSTSGNPTPVFVFQGDAGEWAKKSLYARQRRQRPPSIFARKSAWYDYDFNIILVDPPRAGLDEKVCEMVIDGPFEHILYISCGREALKRDLDRLADHFLVVECLLLDLFPRTSSVESLVHLARKPTTIK